MVKSRIKIEPAHEKTYNKTCATGEDSDQPSGNLKRDKREPLPYWVDV